MHTLYTKIGTGVYCTTYGCALFLSNKFDLTTSYISNAEFFRDLSNYQCSVNLPKNKLLVWLVSKSKMVLTIFWFKRNLFIVTNSNTQVKNSCEIQKLVTLILLLVLPDDELFYKMVFLDRRLQWQPDLVR